MPPLVEYGLKNEFRKSGSAFHNLKIIRGDITKAIIIDMTFFLRNIGQIWTLW